MNAGQQAALSNGHHDPFAGIDDDFEQRVDDISKLKVVDDYDADRFYTRSTNKFDHSHPVQTPFPRDIVAAMDKVVNLRLVPEYTSRHALVRDAVVHRLHYLAAMGGDWEMSDLLAMERVIAAADARRALRQRQTEILDNAEKDLRELYQSGDWEGLEVELDQLTIAMHALSGKNASRLQGIIDQHRGMLERFAG